MFQMERTQIAGEGVALSILCMEDVTAMAEMNK